MSLIVHLNEEDWDALDNAWTELMLADGGLEPVFELLGLAAERKVMPRCLALVKEHASALGEKERHADAAELLGRAMLGGGAPGELSLDLVSHAKQAWSAENWWPVYTELSGLHENAPDMRIAWRSFRKLVMLRDGTAVYHNSGWGIGKIEELDHASQEVLIAFAHGRRDRFPLRTVIDIFEVLDDSDMRALAVTRPEELKRLLDKEPLEVLASVLRRYNGRMQHNVLKGAMAQLGMDSSAFTSWWRKTRKLAETSEWFEVTGQASKAVARLLSSAADPTESLKRQLRMTASLAATTSRVRDLLAGKKLEDKLRQAALQTLADLALDDTHPLPDRLAAWVILRDETKVTPEPLKKRLERAASLPPPADPHEAPPLWRLFGEIPGLREQERCVDLLKELYGEQWLNEAIRNLTYASPGMVRPLCEELASAGRGDELVRLYGLLLARPTRNPHMLIVLGELVEGGRLKGQIPGPVQRAQSHLHLAHYLFKESPGDPVLTRARTRHSLLLCSGKPPLLTRLLETVDKTTLRTLRFTVVSGVDEQIDSVFTDIVVEKAPELFREGEKPFWQSDSIWTTRQGLDRREAELRELKEVKIPANAEAIGRAASFGDLSENSEWEAAIEDQRQLTNRAMEIELEVRGAQLLENAVLPVGIVVPGVAVRFRNLTDGREQEVHILGPWDRGDERVLSYRAPLAAGMMGLRPGQKTEIELPSGQIEVLVLELKPLPL